MNVLDLASSIIKPISDLIDNVTTTDEERLTLKNKLNEIENEAKSRLLDYQSQVIDAKKSVMVAELNQDDKYTKRARPTVLYAGLVILLINNVVLPWLAFFKGLNIPPINLPSEFWLAWGGVAGVYAFGRTKEKIKTKESNNKI